MCVFSLSGFQTLKCWPLGGICFSKQNEEHRLRSKAGMSWKPSSSTETPGHRAETAATTSLSGQTGELGTARLEEKGHVSVKTGCLSGSPPPLSRRLCPPTACPHPAEGRPRPSPPASSLLQGPGSQRATWGPGAVPFDGAGSESPTPEKHVPFRCEVTRTAQWKPWAPAAGQCGCPASPPWPSGLTCPLAVA